MCRDTSVWGRRKSGAKFNSAVSIQQLRGPGLDSARVDTAINNLRQNIVGSSRQSRGRMSSVPARTLECRKFLFPPRRPLDTAGMGHFSLHAVHPLNFPQGDGGGHHFNKSFEPSLIRGKHVMENAFGIANFKPPLSKFLDPPLRLLAEPMRSAQTHRSETWLLCNTPRVLCQRAVLYIHLFWLKLSLPLS